MTSVSISAARLVVLAVLAVAGARIYRHRWWVALEQPWTPSTEVVMKPSLTLNQMRELHGQLEQTRWASRFGSDVPRQFAPPVSVWGAARTVLPQHGVTLNLRPVEQASTLPSQAGMQSPTAPAGDAQQRAFEDRGARRESGGASLSGEGDRSGPWGGGGFVARGSSSRGSMDDRAGQEARKMAWTAAASLLHRAGEEVAREEGPHFEGGGGDRVSASERAAKAAYDHLRGRSQQAVGGWGDGGREDAAAAGQRDRTRAGRYSMAEGTALRRDEVGWRRDRAGQVSAQLSSPFAASAEGDIPQRLGDGASAGPGANARDGRDRSERDEGQSSSDEKRLPAPPPGYPSFGDTEAPAASRAPIDWLHQSAAPPAPRWVREDQEGQGKAGEGTRRGCGWKCVPKSMIAPFNPLSVYQHMTSPSAGLHPPEWVRHDFGGGVGGGATGGFGGGNAMPGPREAGRTKPDAQEQLKRAVEHLGDADGVRSQGGVPVGTDDMLGDGHGGGGAGDAGDLAGTRISSAVVDAAGEGRREHRGQGGAGRQGGEERPGGRREEGGSAAVAGGEGAEAGLQADEERRRTYAAKQDALAAHDLDELDKAEAALSEPSRPPQAARAHASNAKEAALARVLARVAAQQRHTAANNALFRALARKIAPGLAAKFARADRRGVSAPGSGKEARGGTVGLLHQELQKEINEQAEDVGLARELTQVMRKAQTPRFMARESQHAAAKLLAKQETSATADTVRSILAPPAPASSPGTRSLLPALIKKLQEADEDAP